ncbi:MAG: GNAT family N-acyltransferase [Planctomycetota bacterium]
MPVRATRDREVRDDVGAAPDPFRFVPGGPAWRRAVHGMLEMVLSLRALERTYAGLQEESDRQDFLAWAVRAFEIESEVADSDLDRVPGTGGTIVVANHPLGALDGIVLGSILGRRRGDVRILANHLLARIPEMRERCFFVDPFGSTESTQRNRRGLRQAVSWLKDGGLLVVFPAGEVSHWQPGRKEVVDPPWSPTVARLIRRSGACVLPAHLSGRAGMLFHLAGLFHPRLRTALLPRELVRQRGERVVVRFGQPLEPRRVRSLDDDALLSLIRLRSELLPRRSEAGASAAKANPSPVGRARIDRGGRLQAEVDALPSASRLIRAGSFQGLIARASEIPQLLEEIGLQRERTFRAVGEGTGRAIDLDDFDLAYRHLFLWDEERRRLVGAYRVGLAGELLAQAGPSGLYTSTLFQFGPGFVEHLGSALEMGRSFVTAEYQRKPSALFLLWRSIGAFVAVNPRYHRLFGPASISADYSAVSRQLMVQFFERAFWLPELARSVRPRCPWKKQRFGRPIAADAIPSVDELSRLVSDLESDGKGVPVLIREYLQLGGGFVGFHVDRQFQSSLDGLIMVDLTATRRRLLARYLGDEGAQTFLAHHRRKAEPLGESPR